MANNTSGSTGFAWADAIPVIGSTISAIGNLFQSGMSGHQTRKTMREMNQWNLEQWQREVAKQEEWRENERAYNEPSAVVGRLRNAGINPAFALGQIQGQMHTPTPPRGADAAGFVPPSPSFGEIGRGMVNAVDKMLQTRAARNNLAIQEQQLQTGRYSLMLKGLERLVDVANKMQGLKKNSAEAKSAEVAYNYAAKTFNTRVNQADADYARTQAETRLADASIRTLQAQEWLYSEQAKHEQVKQRLTQSQIEQSVMLCQQIAQEIVESHSRVEVNRMMAGNILQQSLTERVKRAGLHLNNQQIEANLPYLEDLLKSEIELNGARKWGAYGSALGSAAGAAIGGLLGIKGISSAGRAVVKGFH